jgi:organic radical activating enzyme
MNLLQRLTQRFRPVQPLPAGVHHYQSPTGEERPYRLHLRLQKDGSGLFILNASTVMHLNPTAAEYAYHFMRGTPPAQAASQIAARYRIGKTQAQEDYQAFVAQLEHLLHSPDLDPVASLGFERVAPNSAALSAPLRLDCALTYRLPPGADPLNAPHKNVQRELNTAEWKTILDKAWALGVPHITFTGGEATLRPDLPELIAHAEKNGQVTGLLTDGHKLTEKEYLDTLLQTGLDHLMLVLPTNGEPDWQALQNALVADIFVAVHQTITPQTLPQARQRMEKLHQAGVEAISLSVSDASLQEPLSRLRDEAAHSGIRLVFDLPVPYSAANPVVFETLPDMPQDGAGRAWLYVEPDGDVLPAQGRAEEILGNFLADAWEKIYPPR